jgi:ATP-dependent DNA helicase RecQ
MRALVQGRDVLAVMPTGYGKSAIYQVAALFIHGGTELTAPRPTAHGAVPPSSFPR